MTTTKELLSELAGKTIKSAAIKKISEEYDDEPYLDIEMTDGSVYRVTSYYGGYTGNSDDEYPAFIGLSKIDVPDKMSSVQSHEAESK